jgi:hypothetical protein
MSSVWIGFIGVIVGGLITTVWSWLAVIRQELGDAMVSARLVDESLAILQQPMLRPGGTASRPIDTEVWEQNRGALARALGRQQWDDVSAVYRRDAGPLLDDSLRECVSKARDALKLLVAGKRYVISQRWRNAFSRPVSGNGGNSSAAA